jgi:hypothetical protein
METLFEPQNILTFLSGIVVPIIVVIIKTKMDRNKLANEDKLAQSVHSSNIINYKIESLKEEFNADRVWITQFHNGGHFYPTGKSIQKFSMFYEAVDPNAQSIRTLFQNIPVSLFSPSTNKILEDNVIAISDFKNETVATYGLKYTAAETGCKSIYIFGIRDINNKLIGTLGIEYVKRKKLLDNINLQMLEIEAAQIGGVLHNHLHEK